MQKLKSVIVEDELHSRESLKKLLLEYCPEVEVIGEATSVATGILLLKSALPELVFMDIMLGDGTSFQMLEALGQRDFTIIFTTAHDEFAIKAIKFNAFDYLLKPIDPSELRQAVANVISRSTLRPDIKPLVDNLKPGKHENPVITLSTADSFEYIHVRDVIRCQADGAYTVFHINGRDPVMVSKTLKEFDQLLTPYQFFRIHQSHLINMREVNRFLKPDGGSVVLHDGSQVPVSRSKKDEFLHMMTGFE